MLTLFHMDQGRLVRTVPQNDVMSLPYNTVWLDLFHPTKEEERVIERLLSIEVPTREEMQEIEASSRLYVDKRAVVMTMPVLSKSSAMMPESSAVTFILVSNRLVTLRYDDPAPFNSFVERLSRHPELGRSGEQALIGLLEQIADRLADIIESATALIEILSHQIFHADSESGDSPNFREMLRKIGHVGDLSTKAKDSLLNLSRLALFLSGQTDLKKETRNHLETLRRDAGSIDEHATYLSERVSFLLDATLGMISLEQNNIIKIFSIVAAGFLPPMLIASIYGMNFHVMPELSWKMGYPLAIVMMILSAVVPYLYFKKKKWL